MQISRTLQDVAKAIGVLAVGVVFLVGLASLWEIWETELRYSRWGSLTWLAVMYAWPWAAGLAILLVCAFFVHEHIRREGFKSWVGLIGVTAAFIGFLVAVEMWPLAAMGGLATVLLGLVLWAWALDRREEDRR